MDDKLEKIKQDFINLNTNIDRMVNNLQRDFTMLGFMIRELGITIKELQEELEKKR